MGTVSNVSKKFSKDFRNVHAVLKSRFTVDTFLVESDSRDNTVEILQTTSQEFANFEFESLGELQLTIADRIERIRYCRNRYVEFIRENIDKKCWKYIVIADLDGMNPRLGSEGLNSCFSRLDWDVCLSNQSGGYYDIFALRHPVWQPRSYFLELEELRNLNIGFPPWLKFFPSKIRNFFEDDFRKNKVIYSKMRKISKSGPWIEVDSGFGGFAIYSSHLFKIYDYSARQHSDPDSEHVDFHLKAREGGAKILINPKLINSSWNTYNLNRIFIIRQVRRLVWQTNILQRFHDCIQSSASR